jgi:hypothetical protein
MYDRDLAAVAPPRTPGRLTCWASVVLTFGQISVSLAVHSLSGTHRGCAFHQSRPAGAASVSRAAGFPSLAPPCFFPPSSHVSVT